MKTAAPYVLKPSDVEDVRFFEGWFRLTPTKDAVAKLAKRGIKGPFRFQIHSEVEEEQLAACCAVSAPGIFYFSGGTGPLAAALDPQIEIDADEDDFYDDIWDEGVDPDSLFSFLQKLPKRLLCPAIDAFFDNIARCAGCKTLLFTLPEPLREESSETHWIVKNSSARALKDFRALSNHGAYYIRGFIWNRPGTAAPAEAARWEVK